MIHDQPRLAVDITHEAGFFAAGVFVGLDQRPAETRLEHPQHHRDGWIASQRGADAALKKPFDEIDDARRF
jgi:hypothetical protein